MIIFKMYSMMNIYIHMVETTSFGQAESSPLGEAFE